MRTKTMCLTLRLTCTCWNKVMLLLTLCSFFWIWGWVPKVVQRLLLWEDVTTCCVVLCSVPQSCQTIHHGFNIFLSACKQIAEVEESHVIVLCCETQGCVCHMLPMQRKLMPIVQLLPFFVSSCNKTKFIFYRDFPKRFHTVHFSHSLWWKWEKRRRHDQQQSCCAKV